MSKESVLILGSSSFAGASMVDFLISKKKYNIYGTYRRKKNKAYLPYLKQSKKIKFKNIKVDFTKNPKKLTNIILKLKPKYIIDFASICMVNQSWENLETYININILYYIYSIIGSLVFYCIYCSSNFSLSDMVAISFPMLLIVGGAMLKMIGSEKFSKIFSKYENFNALFKDLWLYILLWIIIAIMTLKEIFF